MKTHCVLLFALWAALSLSAQTTAISNRSQTASGGITVGKGSAFDFVEAFSFTTGASAQTLTSITFQAIATNGSASGFTAALFSSFSASGPAGFVAGLDGSFNPSGFAPYTYTPS